MIDAGNGFQPREQVGSVRPAAEVPPGPVESAGQRVQEARECLEGRCLHRAHALQRTQRELDGDVDPHVVGPDDDDISRGDGVLDDEATHTLQEFDRGHGLRIPRPWNDDETDDADSRLLRVGVGGQVAERHALGPRYFGRGEHRQIFVVLQGHRSTAVPDRARGALQHRVEALSVGAAGRRLRARHLFYVRHRLFQLHDRARRSVASYSAARLIARQPNVARAGRWDHPAQAITEPDLPGEMIEHVVPIPRPRAVEVRHLMPPHPDFPGAAGRRTRHRNRVRALVGPDRGLVLYRGEVRLANLELLAEQHGSPGGPERLVLAPIAGAEGFVLRGHRLDRRRRVREQPPHPRQERIVSALPPRSEPVPREPEFLAKGGVGRGEELDEPRPSERLCAVARRQRGPGQPVPVLPGQSRRDRGGKVVCSFAVPDIGCLPIQRERSVRERRPAGGKDEPEVDGGFHVPGRREGCERCGGIPGLDLEVIRGQHGIRWA